MLLEEHYLAEISNLRNGYNHTYTSVGDYKIIVRASNDRNSLNATVLAAVDIRITGLNYSLEHAVVGSPIKDKLEANSGSRISVFWTYGNGFAEEKYYANYTLLPYETPHTYQYANNLTVYNLTVFVSNSLGMHKFQVQAAVTEVIKDLKVCKSDPVSVTNPMVNFSQTIMAGKHMTCGRYFGDNILWIVYQDDPPLSQNYSHTYPAKVGRYDFVLRCYNFLDYFIFIMNEVLVVEELDGGMVNLPDTSWVNQAWDEDIHIPYSFVNGTNATCLALLDGSLENVSYAQANSGPSSGNYTKSGKILSVGQHTLDISCTNLVGSHNFSQIILNVQKKIANLTLMALQTHLEPTETFDFYANTTEGTLVKYKLNFDDGTAEQNTEMTQNEGAYNEHITHVYTAPGYYTVTVNASNNVSSSEATFDVGVEFPVLAGIVMTVQNKTRPSEIVPFTITHPAGNTPTSTKVACDYLNNGTIDFEENMVISAGTPYTYQHQYQHYGDFIASCTISNNVSSVTVTVPFRVGLEITNFYCIDVDPYMHAVGVQMNFKCHVDSGSKVIYRGQFDSSSFVDPPTGRTSTVNWAAADDKIIPFTYYQPGYYKANFSAENMFGFNNVTVDLFVFQQVDGLTLVSMKKYLEPTQTFEFYGNITAGSKVEFEFDFADESTNQTKTMDQTEGDFRQLIQYTYTKNDYFTVGVTARNNVSSAIAFFDIGVEYPVPVDIILTATNVTRPEIPVVFTVTHPSSNIPNPDSTEASWDYKVGTPNLIEAMVLGDGVQYSTQYQYSIYGDLGAEVTISNNVSSVTVTVPFRVGLEITNFYCIDVDPYMHAVGVQMNFKCHVDSGSKVIYRGQFDSSSFVDPPTGRTSTVNWAAADDKIIPFTYYQPGYYKANFSAENMFGFNNVTVDLFVFQQVDGLTLVSMKKYLEPTQTFEFYGNITAGSKVEFEFDFADESTNKTKTMDQTEGDFRQLIQYTYTKNDYFTVGVTARNNVSSAIAFFDIGVEYPVPVDIVLTATNVTRPEIHVVFTVTHPSSNIPNPDSTEASWDYNKVGTPNLIEAMVLGDGVQYSTQYQYSIYGDLGAEVTISNNVSSVTVTVPFRVGLEITNFYCIDVDPYMHAVGVQMNFKCHVDSGSKVIYRGQFDSSSFVDPPTGRTSTVNWAAADDKIIPFTYYQPGYYKANFSAENMFGFNNVTVDLFVFQQVDGLTLVSMKKYLEPTQTFEFYGNITAGSKVEFEFDFADESTNQTITMDQTEGDFRQLIRYAYTKNDYFTVGVTARNNVSSAIAFVDIGVEYPVPVDIVLTATNVTRPEIPVVFTVTHPSSNIPNPDSTEASWDYNKVGTPNLVETMVLGDGVQYSTQYQYSIYADLGAEVTMRNNVSSVTKSVEFRIGVVLKDFTVALMNPPLEVGVQMTYTCRVAQGSTVLYNVDFGDSETVTVPRTQITYWEKPDNTTIPHTYTTTGTFSIRFEAINNTYSGPLIRTMDITLYAKILGVMVNSTHQYAKVGEAVTLTVSVRQGSIVTSYLDFGDGSAQSSKSDHSAFSAMQTPVTFIHPYNTAGNYSVTAYSENSLSTTSVESDGFIYLSNNRISNVIIQEEVVSITLSVSKNIVPVPDGVVQYTVKNTRLKKPTDLFCTWTYPDGTSDWTYAGILMDDPEGKHLHSHTFPGEFVGTHITKVNCSNFVSFANAEVSVTFQQKIVDPVVTPIKDKVKVNEPCSFYITVARGSHLNYNAKYKDTTEDSKAALEANKLNGSVSFEMSHTYTSSANYTVDIRVYNDVSEKTVSLVIYVQQPLEDDSLVIVANDAKSVKYPPGKLPFTVTPKQPGPFPDNVFLFWNFGADDPVGDPDFAIDLTLGKTYLKEYTYQNADQSMYKTIVNASNMVSSIQVIVDVKIMREIEGLKLDLINSNHPTEKVVETGTVVQINASIVHGTEVTYTLTTGDGQTLTGNPVADKFYKFEHTYSSPDSYTVEGGATNEVSSQTSTLGKIRVQNKVISELTTITCDSFIKMDKATNSGHLNIEISVKNPEPTSVTFTFLTEGGSSQVRSISSWPFIHKHTYQYAGNMNTNPLVDITLFNLISNFTKQCQPQIQEELTGLSVEVLSIISTNTLATINVTLTSGSYFKVKAEYGDGQIYNNMFNGSVRFIQLEHNYTTAGFYDVKVSIENDVTANVPLVIQGKNIKVLNHIPELKVVANSTTAVSDTEIFEILIDKKIATDSYPTEATVEIDFGDGSSKVNEDKVLLTKPYVKTHQYTKNGIYTVKVVVKNAINDKILTHNVTAEKRIKGLSITVTNVKTNLQYNENDAIPTSTDLQFAATITDGTNVRTKWTIDGNSYYNSSFQHTFAIPNDQYVLTVELSNALGSTFVSRPLKIVSSNGIKSFTYDTSVIVHNKVNFNITTKKLATDLCFELTLNATTTTKVIRHWLGPKIERCQSSANFKQSEFDKTGETDSFVYSPQLDVIGEYLVTLTLLTQATPVITSDPSRLLAVVDKPCFDPVVTILDQATDATAGTISNPISYKKGAAITAPKKGINIKKDCQATNITVIQWQMYKLSGGQEQLIQINDSMYGGKVYNDRLEFPAKIMPYGNYHIIIKVSMAGFPKKSGSAGFYIKVTSSQLVTSLVDSQRRGSGDILSLSALETTSDPDSGNQEGIEYTWYCGQMDPGDGTACPEGQVCEEGLTEAVVANWTSSGTPIQVPDIVPTELPDPFTGCFGTGPGELDVKSGNLVFNTGAMKSSRWYRFVLKVSKGDRAVYTISTVEITPGKPPEIDVSCYDTTSYLKFCSWNYVTPSILYDLLISCKSCGANQKPTLSFDIKLPSSKRRKRSLAEDIKNKISTTQNTDGKFVLHIPENTLPLKSKVKIEITIAVVGLEDGKVTYNLNTNGLPYGGTFEVEPKVAQSLATNVEMKPSGWKPYDTEQSPFDLQYEYEYCIVFTNPENPENCTKLSVSPATLSQGLEENQYKVGLRLSVCDLNMNCKMTDLTYITVEPPADGAADAALAKAMDESNPAQMMDTILTVSVAISITPAPAPAPPPSSGSPSSGGSNFAQQTTAQKEAEEAAVKKAKQEEEKKNKLMASIVTNLVSISTTTKGGAAPLTTKQKLQAISTMASVSKKLSPDSSDAALGGMTFITAMAADLENMDSNDRANAINGILNVAGSVSSKMEVEVVIVPPAPVNVDVVVDEAAQEEAAKRAAEEKEREKQNGLSAAESISTTANDIANTAKTVLVPDGEGVVFGSETLQVTARLASASTLSNSTYVNPEFNMTLPMIAPTDGQLFLQMVYVQANMYSFDDSAAAISTGVTKVSMENENKEPFSMNLDKSNPVAVSHNTKEGEENYVDMSNATVDKISNLVYMHVPVDVNNSAFLSCMKPEDSNVRFGIFIKFNVSASDQRKPNQTAGEHDYKDVQTTEQTGFCINVPENHVFSPGFYIGISVTVHRQVRSATTNSTLPKFKMNSVLSRCRAWDSVNLKWVTDKCTVGKRSNVGRTECECTELTPAVNSYAGGVTVPKVNTIDFKNVFSNFAALLAANPTVFAVMISIIVLYVLLGVWVRYKDKKDVEKWGVSPLADNKSHGDVYYKVSFFTGMRQGAGTKSKVCFILSGEGGDTGVRVADDGKGKHYGRGSVRHFAMRTDFDIGAATFLRIWHDNSGGGAYASWFLDKVAIENLQTKTRYYFFCSRWLAADEDDGQVDRMIPVAGSQELENFNKLFFSKTRKNLTDDHLWFSILSRPTKSSFNRLQRLTCCVSLLFTTMIANAMFFRSASETDASANEADTRVKIGPIVLSVNTLLVSIFGALVVIPVNAIVVQFFRKSKPKYWKEADEDELNEIKQSMKKDGGVSLADSPEAEPPKKKKQRFWKKKYPLPYQCIYIAWGLSILSIVVSAFFVILYSLDWGEEKSLEWMSSLILSFCQSVVFIQPVKIIFLAAIISVIFKTFDEMDDEKENKETNAKPKEDETLEEEDDMIKLTKAPIAYIPNPPSKRKLENARKMRVYEKKMWGIVKEVIYYFMFLMLISFIAWGNKDDIVYKMNSHIKRVINTGLDPDTLHGDSVLTGHDFWQWLNETAIPSIFYDEKYNGNKTTVRDRSFMSDMVSYRVGAIRLRQSRVLPGSCSVPNAAKDVILECNKGYSFPVAETRNFSTGWYLDINGTGSNLQHDQLSKIEKSFKYFDTIDLKNLPYWGLMATYSGGGYVADLGTSRYQAQKLIGQLIEHSWIDYYTRAVFMEFTVYNPSINLFAYVNYLMEFPPSGAVFPSERITSFQVYSVVAGMGSAVVAAQIIYCVILIYFIVREIIKLKNQRKAYWSEPWNWLEFSVIVGSIVAIAMFVLREQFGRLVMNSLKEDIEQFTNYSGLALYNENIDYVVGFLIFLANIKFLKLLRFNKHISELSNTLKHARVDMGYFFLTFFILFMGFAIWGYIIFGKVNYNFSTFVSTLQTMFSMLIGKFDLNGMDEADRYMGKLFFIAFTIVIFFIIVNMFLGILTMAYEEVRLLPVNPLADYKVIGFFLKKIKKFFNMKIESENHGEGYLSATDVVQLRLTALDQHISHLYNESIAQMKEQKNKDNKTSQSKKSLKDTLKRMAEKSKLQGNKGNSLFSKLKLKGQI